MKLIVLTVLAIASLFAGGNLYAQNLVVATVPFDFHVGQAVMPSGAYEFRPWSNNVLLVRHTTKGIAVLHLIYSNGTKQNEKSELIFHKYTASPATYFLSEVRGLPATGSMALPACSLEKRLQKELQGTVRTSETITVPQAAEPQEP